MFEAPLPKPRLFDPLFCGDCRRPRTFCNCVERLDFLRRLDEAFEEARGYGWPKDFKLTEDDKQFLRDLQIASV